MLSILAVGGCAADSNGQSEPGPSGASVATVATDDAAEAAAAKNSALTASVPSRSSVASGDSAVRVLIAGTSLTAGLGLDPADAYPAVLQQLADSAGLPVNIVNAGSSGETSAGLVRRMDWLLREPADVVVIETGANDGLRGLNPAVTKANLRQIVKEVRERIPQARVALVQMEAPPNLGVGYTSRFHSMYAEVARESGATLVPFLLEGVAGVASLNQADGIHPNEAGARAAAHNVWKVLGPLLAEVDQSGNFR